MIMRYSALKSMSESWFRTYSDVSLFSWRSFGDGRVKKYYRYRSSWSEGKVYSFRGKFHDSKN